VATKLTVYNNSLIILGERTLSSLTENRKSRRLLDKAWDSNFVKECLEDGFWNFGTRTVLSDYNPSISPDFGLGYAHDKPTDWVRTAAISLDENLNDPLINYRDEQEYLFVDSQTIYWSYVSDDDDYGGDLSIWTESFTRYVETKLAARICMALTQSTSETNRLIKLAEDMCKSAKSKNAMNNPPKFTPLGSWNRSRRGGRGTPNNFRSV
jgi:hypothetical protein